MAERRVEGTLVVEDRVCLARATEAAGARLPPQKLMMTSNLLKAAPKRAKVPGRVLGLAFLTLSLCLSLGCGAPSNDTTTLELASSPKPEPGRAPLTSGKAVSIVGPSTVPAVPALPTVTPSVPTISPPLPPIIGAINQSALWAQWARACPSAPPQDTLLAALAAIALEVFDGLGSSAYVQECNDPSFQGCYLVVSDTAREQAKRLQQEEHLERAEQLLRLIAHQDPARRSLLDGHEAAQARCQRERCVREPLYAKRTARQDECGHLITNLQLPAEDRVRQALLELRELYGTGNSLITLANGDPNSAGAQRKRASGIALKSQDQADTIDVELVTQSYLNPECNGTNERTHDECYHNLYDASSFCHVTQGGFGVLQRLGECCVREYACDDATGSVVVGGELEDFLNMSIYSHCHYSVPEKALEGACR